MNQFKVKAWRKSKITDKEDLEFKLVSWDAVVKELHTLLFAADPLVAIDITVEKMES